MISNSTPFWDDTVARLRALPDDHARETLLATFNERTRASLVYILDQKPSLKPQI